MRNQLPRAVVLGASGFAGGHMANHLAETGYDVVAILRPNAKREHLQVERIRIVERQITEAGALDDVLAQDDLVFNFAGAFRIEFPDREPYREVNVKALRNSLDSAARQKVRRFIHGSTIGVHGDIEDPPANEEYRFAPGDYYQESKLEGEQLAREYFRKGLPGVVLRPTSMYGPGDLRLLKLFRSVKNGTFRMIGQGKAYLHLVYIDDLARGALLAATEPHALGEVFILGGLRYVSLNELVATIAANFGQTTRRFHIPYWPVYAASFACAAACRPLGVQPPLFPRRVKFFRNSRAFDITKARQILGYEPAIDLAEGIRRTADWYAREGLL